MVASFIKVDTIPRLFLKILKKKLDEFTNKLSFVTSEKSKREAMSEVTGFFTEVNDQFILEVSAQDTQVKYFFFLNYITLEHDITFTFRPV